MEVVGEQRADTERPVMHHRYELRPTMARAHRTFAPALPIRKSPPCATTVLRRKGFHTYASCLLGHGNFSKVYSAMKGNRKVAVKVVRLQSVNEDYRARFLPREIACWSKISHNHVCKLFEHFSYKDDFLFMVTEYCSKGDLLTYVQKKGALSDDLGRYWLEQVMQAVSHLHTKLISHRDIKAENILIAEDLTVRLADFGFAHEASNVDELCRTYCGSRIYSAPEILKAVPYNPFKADVWSLGALVYVAMTGSMPFRESTPHTLLMQQQQAGRYSWPKYVSEDCRAAVEKMMTYEEALRPTVFSAAQLPFFRPRQ